MEATAQAFQAMSVYVVAMYRTFGSEWGHTAALALVSGAIALVFVGEARLLAIQARLEAWTAKDDARLARLKETRTWVLRIQAEKDAEFEEAERREAAKMQAWIEKEMSNLSDYSGEPTDLSIEEATDRAGRKAVEQDDYPAPAGSDDDTWPRSSSKKSAEELTEASPEGSAPSRPGSPGGTAIAQPRWKHRGATGRRIRTSRQITPEPSDGGESSNESEASEVLALPSNVTGLPPSPELSSDKPNPGPTSSEEPFSSSSVPEISRARRFPGERHYTATYSWKELQWYYARIVLAVVAGGNRGTAERFERITSIKTGTAVPRRPGSARRPMPVDKRDRKRSTDITGTDATATARPFEMAPRPVETGTRAAASRDLSYQDSTAGTSADEADSNACDGDTESGYEASEDEF